MANEQNLIGEELAALQDEEAIAEEKAAAKTRGEDGNDDDGPSDAAPAAAAQADAKPAAEAAPAAAPSPAPTGEEPAPALNLEQPFSAPVPVVEDTDFAAERDVLLDRRKELRQQLRNGDLDQDSFDEKLDEVNDQINKLDVRVARNESAIAQNAALRAAQWGWTIDQVKRHVKATDNIDYDAKENAGLLAAWDRQIKALARDEANEDKPAEWFAIEAHRLVRAEIEATAEKFGLRRVGDAKATPKADDKVKEALKGRKPDLSAAKSLADLPSAEAAATGDQDQFEHLDKLSGLELERALAKMPKDQADAYLNGQ